LLLAVNVKAVTVSMPVQTEPSHRLMSHTSGRFSGNFNATTTSNSSSNNSNNNNNNKLLHDLNVRLKIDGIQIMSKNSTGASDVLHAASESKELMHGSYDMHDVQVSSIKVTFNSAVRNVLTNLKSNTIEERILLVEELSLNYFVSRIPDHPKWPREMIAIEIPKGKQQFFYFFSSGSFFVFFFFLFF
jgi:hypothetical protein